MADAIPANAPGGAGGRSSRHRIAAAVLFTLSSLSILGSIALGAVDYYSPEGHLYRIAIVAAKTAGAVPARPYRGATLAQTMLLQPTSVLAGVFLIAAVAAAVSYSRRRRRSRAS